MNMRETMNIKLPVILVLVVIAVLCAIMLLKQKKAAGSISPEQKALREKYITTLDDVSYDMLSADYWIAKYPDADKVIMTADQIKEWNSLEIENINDITVRNNETPNFHMTAGKQSLTKEELTRTLAALDYAEDAVLFDENGKALGNAHWESARLNRNEAAVKDENPIHYGFTTQYSELRKLPTLERAFQNEDNQQFDDSTNSSAIVNEPVIILHESADKEWYYIQNSYAEGWALSENVGICDSYEEWLSLQEGEFLIVTGERITLPDEVGQPNGGKELSMGTKLRIVDPDTVPEYLYQRRGHNSYIVQMPERGENGKLSLHEVYVPAHYDVNIGYLDYTAANVLRQAFKTLGERYGWGGSFNARDCTALSADIYRCFGIRTERNSRAQCEMVGKRLLMEEMTDSEKLELLKKQSIPGSLLYFPGHIFLYLGTENGKIYTISSAGSLCPDTPDGTMTYYMSVMVNSLDVKRRNGKTWLESLTRNIILTL